MRNFRYSDSLGYHIDNIGYASVERNEGYTVPYKEGKKRPSVIMLEEGAMRYAFDDVTFILEKGDSLFVPARLPYVATYLEDGTQMNMLMFNALPDKGELPLLFFSPVKKRLPHAAAFFAGLAQHATDTPFLLGKIYELLSLFLHETADVPQKYKKIQPAIEAIGRLYFENKPVSYYAELCNMSESNFRKLFRAYTGRSPIEYRNLIRISEAQKLIEEGECTTTEAACVTGFNNLSFFYELYRKYRENK